MLKWIRLQGQSNCKGLIWVYLASVPAVSGDCDHGGQREQEYQLLLHEGQSRNLHRKDNLGNKYKQLKIFERPKISLIPSPFLHPYYKLVK